MRRKTRGVNIPAHVANPRRKPRPRAKWAYQGHDSANEWVNRAHDSSRILHASAVLMDGRSGNARMYRQVSEQLLQGIVCVHQLIREIERIEAEHETEDS